MTLAEEPTGWLTLHTYSSNTYVGAALELFGQEAMSGNSMIVLQMGVQTAIAQLVTHAWARIHKVYNRKEAATTKQKAAFDQQWAGEHS